MKTEPFAELARAIWQVDGSNSLSWKAGHLKRLLTPLLAQAAREIAAAQEGDEGQESYYVNEDKVLAILTSTLGGQRNGK